LPSDYWRNPQMYNVFRTKMCQRLLRGNTCAWGSQCQFSHSLHWPRRPHRGHSYSPELCPHICVSAGTERGEVRVENCCPTGPKCGFAHSKEEVLYHPHILKTCLCEEHASRQGGSSRGRRKRHCHRHYCPFAHGSKELRASPLSPELRKQYLLDAMQKFPSNWCCKVCEPHEVRLLASGRQRGGGRELSFILPATPPSEREGVPDTPTMSWPLGTAPPPPNAAAAAVPAASGPSWAAAAAAAAAGLQQSAAVDVSEGPPRPLPSQSGALAIGQLDHALPQRVSEDSEKRIAMLFVDSPRTYLSKFPEAHSTAVPTGVSGSDEDDDSTDDTPLPPYGGEPFDVFYENPDIFEQQDWNKEEERLASFLGL